MRPAIKLVVNKSPLTRQKGKMRSDMFELSIAVPSKRDGMVKIPEYGHNGLTFIEGRKGQPFHLKMRNDSAHRVMAVVSIDGLSIVDGQTCTAQSRGYVIPAYSAITVQGWRTSLTEVNTFKFETKEGGSYARRMGVETQNCGVIAAKFFSEKWKPSPGLQTIIEKHHHHHHHDKWPWSDPPYRPWRYPSWPDVYMSSTGGDGLGASQGANEMVRCSLMSSGLNRNAPNSGTTAQYSGTLKQSGAPITVNMAQADVPDFTLGTGWGEAKVDVVTETTFETAAELCTMTLYYAASEDLKKAGIALDKGVTVATAIKPVLPQAFQGFCKPPVNR